MKQIEFKCPYCGEAIFGGRRCPKFHNVHVLRRDKPKNRFVVCRGGSFETTQLENYYVTRR